jgi:hypothetical protein
MRFESPDPAFLKLPPRSLRSLFPRIKFPSPVPPSPGLHITIPCMLRDAAQYFCCGHHARHPLENVSSRTSNPVVPKRTCIKISVAHPADNPGVRQWLHRQADTPTHCRSSVVPAGRGTSTLQWTLLLLGGSRRWLGRVLEVMKSRGTACITFQSSRLPRRRCFTSRRRKGGWASEMGTTVMG